MAQGTLAVLALASIASVAQPALFERSTPQLRGNAAQRGDAGLQVRPLSPVGPETPIHLLISAFQDGPRCANTLYRALRQAEHQERISFSVLQAVGEGDVNCLEEFRSKHMPLLCAGGAAKPSGCAAEVLARVHFWTIPPTEGKGPVHQRGLLSERADLSGDGSMCLSMDSHMDFTPHWDSDLLEDWAAAENEFAVLTAYPLATSDVAVAGKRSWISLCGYFLADGVPRGATGGTMFNGRGGLRSRPMLTMNWAAGQSFSRCHAERNVPVDKHLMWMFNGEEVNRAVRLWTHGYDLYNPRVNVVLHNYTHATQRFWSYRSGSQAADEAASNRRLQALLQGDAAAAGFGRYGLGDQRTLEEYVTWSRTDLGGRWGAFLKRKGLAPALGGNGNSGGAGQPGSVTDFCEGLQRAPVRSAQELAETAKA
mmetsp:Transcript_86641/g.240226  ORF Transcript_86641/g.240226 Transcript_86641/m.240226 type:complete len:425 (-) Transcript_86641:77-1351(-)|eukprot:CAMPEP_0179118600 /NCGR_PEP_ID=MMETSP0796-20121207/55786_1 /TAXON_ID=73915 /ORGANISM="Pyrodinium bahamense, Strain pbaha01" /LENGTH=424 /DNA_ID=CAMNT_0020817061 /DNA_START=103 /DNA_END=1377 /DNA_ORIENTATION=+